MRLHTFMAGAAVLAAFAAAPANAQTSDDAFLKCAGEPDSLLRLICYDEAVGELRKTRGSASPAPLAGSTAPTAPRRVGGGTAPLSQEVFTGTTTSTSRGGSLGETAPGTYNVYAMTRAGRDIAIQLDNGQIWRQIDGRDHTLPRSRENLTVELVPAFQNSYFMTVSEGGTERIRQMRVRRVK